MIHIGKERRRHRVYVTRNTEYHLRDGVCVAVRDRHSASFRPAHLALRLRLEGRVCIYDNGAAIPNADQPEVGDCLFFSFARSDGEETQLVTSKVEQIVRPAKAVVESYSV